MKPRKWFIQKPISNNCPVGQGGPNEVAVFQDFAPTVSKQNHEWVEVIEKAAYDKELLEKSKLIRLLISSSYNAYAANLHGLECSKASQYRDYKVGDTVLEISSIFRRDYDDSRIGKLVEIKELTNDYDKIYSLELLLDGSIFTWSNCSFIKVHDEILKGRLE